MKHFVQEKNLEALSISAANFIISIAKKSIKARGKFTIALSGGSTPKALFTLLATQEYASQIDWKNTYVFWSDERTVPLDDEENNAKMAIDSLLSKVAIPKKNIYRIASNLSAQKAAQKYEASILSFFDNKKPSLDICLLGLGDDGHTASLFPNTTILEQTKAWVKEVYVPKLDTNRISFTIPMILAAKNIVFFIAGKNKAIVLDKIITGDYTPAKYPAQFIQGKSKSIYYFYDEAAGKKLELYLKQTS